MPNVKTAISLDADLLKRVNDAAANLQVSRNRLLVQVVEGFIQGVESQRFLKNLNVAYDAPLSKEEEKVEHHIREKRRSLWQESAW
ncbi:MAG: hypothetical protein VX610_05605 [SAR324 cluster bacterium]|nr:hypothetical protein [SAR324 cluster bacterium]